MTKETLPTVTDTEYKISSFDQGDITSLIKDNMGGQMLTEFDLDRIRTPSSGNLAFTVPTLQGDTIAESVEGVIIYHRVARAYWQIGYDDSGGGTPPDCSSVDGFVGVGDPGGDCLRCPLSKFGSEPKKERGQACKQMQVIFLLEKNKIMPTVIAAPPTSLRPLRQYLLRLAQAEKRYWQVTTKFGLTKQSNKDGLDFSQITPTMTGEIAGDELPGITKYAEMMKPMLTALVVDMSAENTAA